MAPSPPINDKLFNRSDLHDLFYYHLNLIYCAKSHLSERFENTLLLPDFTDIREHMDQMIGYTHIILREFDGLFIYLDSEPDFSEMFTTIDLLEQMFYKVEAHAIPLASRSLYLFQYVQFVESLDRSGREVLSLIVQHYGDKALRERVEQYTTSFIAESELLDILTAQIGRAGQ